MQYKTLIKDHISTIAPKVGIDSVVTDKDIKIYHPFSILVKAASWLQRVILNKSLVENYVWTIPPKFAAYWICILKPEDYYMNLP